MEVKGRFDHFNINVTNLERSTAFYKQALGLLPCGEIDGPEGAFKILYLKNDSSDFMLELTWLRDHPEAYDLGECEFHLCLRDPHIDPLEALTIKRRIDRSNQDRTDLVEQIDSYFRQYFSNVVPGPDARLNTESPAWAVDRLSILALKIYHMREQVNREDATPEHRQRCNDKLNVLLEQQKDLSLAIDQLLEDIAEGKKYMKVYRQMKMYNDPNTNPILYNNKP